MAKNNAPPKPPRNPKKPKIKAWKPSEKQLGWYRQWIVDRKGPSEIARRHIHQVSRQAVCRDVHRVDDWIRNKSIDQILSYRRRQIMQFEMVMRESLMAWRASKGEVVTEITSGDGSHPKQAIEVEYCHGNPAYLMQYMQAMKGISDLLGLLKAGNPEITTPHAEEIEGVPGMQGFACRGDALRAQAEAMLVLAEQADRTDAARALRCADSDE